jgi:hypothetical protein
MLVSCLLCRCARGSNRSVFLRCWLLIFAFPCVGTMILQRICGAFVSYTSITICIELVGNTF